jgi:hypothetical protein
MERMAGVGYPQNWHNRLYYALEVLISFKVPTLIHIDPKVTSLSITSTPGGKFPILARYYSVDYAFKFKCLLLAVYSIN